MKIVMLVALTTFVASNANAQKIHAIVVGDTLDKNIGVGIIKNMEKIGTFLQEVQNVGDMTVSVKEIKGGQFECKSIMEAVQQMKQSVASDDAVIFYYAAHGFRTDTTKTKFPEFTCKRTQNSPDAGLSIVVEELLKEKKPRFVLAIADTCNGVGSPLLPRGKLLPTTNKKAGLRHLFLDYSGTLMMSSAKPWENAWYMVEGDADKIGGLFTGQLLPIITEQIAANDAKVRWEDIARAGTIPITVDDGVNTQTPQFEAPNLHGKIRD
jgi:hypothetical protein